MQQQHIHTPLSIHLVAAIIVPVCLILLLPSFLSISYFILFLLVKYEISLNEYYHDFTTLSTLILKK